MIPLSIPCIQGNEVLYVTEALTKGWVSSGGEFVTRLERNLKEYLNTSGCVALQSGTAAIHLALLLSKVLPGDEVIVPTLTFIASVNPVKYLHAEPVFMDCDDSLTLDCDKLEQFLANECVLTKEGLKNKSSNRFIKAIIVVHVFGNMADMVRLCKLAKTYQLSLIEDATEALGSVYDKGSLCGKFAGTIGDFGAFSFNGNKIITTGGGGMLTAKEDIMLSKAKYLSTQAKDDALHFVHDEIGYNYRMTNVQAAMGVAQLERLEEFITIKRDNYDYYCEQLNIRKDISLLPFQDEVRSNKWFYSLLLSNLVASKDIVIQTLKEHAIEARPIWKLCHAQKMYQKNQAYYIEKALYYWNYVVNIPCSVSLTKEEIDSVVKVIEGLS